MRRTRKSLFPLIAVALAAGACESSPAGVDPTQDTPQAALVGRIDGGGASASLVPLHSRSSSGAGITVAVARVQADGALEALASATAAADGSYRIEKVPAGIDRLVVVATSGSGAEVGRGIVHQALTAGATATAAPINGETTVEARVFGELVRSGMAREAVNTVELAQSLEVSGKSTAEALVQSATELRALAEGFRARQEAYTQVLSARGVSLDAGARFQAALPAAVAYAQERHAGAEEKAAAAKVSAAVADAYRAKGADHRAQAEASGAAETALVRAGDVTHADARLDVARGARQVNLLARERLVTDALTALGAPSAQVDAARQQFAEARASVAGAGTVEAMDQAVARASAAIQAAFESHLLQSGRIPQTAQSRITTALQNLPSQADLEARLGGATRGGEVASAYVAFLDDLRTAVQSAVNLIVSSGGAVDGKAVADLFTGLRTTVQQR